MERRGGFVGSREGVTDGEGEGEGDDEAVWRA